MLFKTVVDTIKDKNSLIKAKFSRRNPLRDYDLEASIIKATSHDQYVIDRWNVEMVFSWIRASPVTLHPFVWALSKRMEKTKSWVVAVKGLMLMHGAIHCKVPAVRNMGRLPFDLSSFVDRNSKSCGFDGFVRDYFEFLDERATVSFDQRGKRSPQGRSLMLRRLLKIQKWQSLLDLSLKVRPTVQDQDVGLIIEAMNCVAFEMFDIYKRICDEIAKILSQVHSMDKLEAELALKILQKATKQAEIISPLLKVEKNFYGNADELPTVPQILDKDIQRKLERIVNGDSDKTCGDIGFVDNNKKLAEVLTQDNHVDAINVRRRESKGTNLKTIITDKWVVFDEHLNIKSVTKETAAKDLNLISIDPMPVRSSYYEMPDLITFI